jgi:hypothetical protein
MERPIVLLLLYLWGRCRSSRKAYVERHQTALPVYDRRQRWRHLVEPRAIKPETLKSILGTAFPSGTICGGLGLYTSSYINSYTDYNVYSQALTSATGLITYNYTSRTWANESLSPLTETYIYGKVQCLPSYGTNGVAIFIDGTTGVADSAPVMSLTNLTIYDPVSKEWYWQATSEDIPPGRSRHCAVSVQSPTGNTTEM